MHDAENLITSAKRIPWNKGKVEGGETIVAAKACLGNPDQAPDRPANARPRAVQSRVDSKLRGCDLVAVMVDDVAPNGYAVDRASVRQKKTGRPVRFEVTEPTRQAIDDYIKLEDKKLREFLFTGRRPGQGMTTRQYARLLSEWLTSVGLDPHLYGTHSLRQTKATLI